MYDDYIKAKIQGISDKKTIIEPIQTECQAGIWKKWKQLVGVTSKDDLTFAILCASFNFKRLTWSLIITKYFNKLHGDEKYS